MDETQMLLTQNKRIFSLGANAVEALKLRTAGYDPKTYIIVPIRAKHFQPFSGGTIAETFVTTANNVTRTRLWNVAEAITVPKDSCAVIFGIEIKSVSGVVPLEDNYIEIQLNNQVRAVLDLREIMNHDGGMMVMFTGVFVIKPNTKLDIWLYHTSGGARTFEIKPIGFMCAPYDVIGRD
ncbi:MAG: hypothetical protein M0R66_07640 [Candidatus Omnitrophica bacterium]|nr:hypothetical protein [Candidatus Omnitrophota bacterium]